MYKLETDSGKMDKIIEVELSDEYSRSFEMSNFIGRTYSKQQGILSLKQTMYLFKMNEISKNFWDNVTQLEKITSKYNQKIPMTEWLYESSYKKFRIADNLKKVNKNEFSSQTIKNICSFIEQAYRHKELKEFNPQVRIIIKNIKNEIQGISTRVEFYKKQ